MKEYEEDQKNIVAEAFENMVEKSRFPWTWIIVGASIIYLLARFIPWAIYGFPVVK